MADAISDSYSILTVDEYKSLSFSFVSFSSRLQNLKVTTHFKVIVMHSSCLFLVLSPLFLFSISSAIPSPNHVVFEKRQDTEWTKTGKPNPRTILPVRIGLSGTNLEHGHELLIDVSNPPSPNYGKHWTFDQVNSAFAPSQATVNATTTWLQESGIAGRRITQTRSGGYLTFDATVDELEGLLKTEYYLYQHPDSEYQAVACDL